MEFAKEWTFGKLVREAASDAGRPIHISELKEALVFCKRKNELLGKGVSYLPLLIRYELPHIVFRNDFRGAYGN